jgi:3-phenylpropionate/trans-cinnamate dioxygenase ferredoxin subunit
MAPVRVATTSEIPAGSVSGFDVDGVMVAIANVNGEFYAIHDVCSHAFAILSEGDLDTDDCTLSCPMHGSAFDLRSGRPRSFPAFEPVPVYKVSVEGDDIFVDTAS